MSQEIYYYLISLNFFGRSNYIYDSHLLLSNYEKLIVKPSNKSIEKVTENISDIIKRGKAWKQEDLIKYLNPVITGWANYHPATRNYIINCRNATPSIRSDLIMACVFSNGNV